MYAALLKVVMAADGLVLALFGLGLVLAPGQMFKLFQLEGLPPGVAYIAGMWGALLLTLALGYLAGSADPERHLILVQVGIVRAIVEVAVSIYYVSTGAVTIMQGAAGLFLAVWFALAYLVLYPRSRPAIETAVRG